MGANGCKYGCKWVQIDPTMGANGCKWVQAFFSSNKPTCTYCTYCTYKKVKVCSSREKAYPCSSNMKAL